MEDFWSETSLLSPTAPAAAATKKSSIPVRRRRPRVEAVTAAPEPVNTAKTIMERLAKATSDAERESDALMAGAGLSTDVAESQAGLKYERPNTPGSGAKAPKSFTPSRTAKTAPAAPASKPAPAMPTLEALEETVALTEREMLILEVTAENGRLTLEMITYYIAHLEGKTGSEIARLSETLRRGALSRLQEKKCLKKITPPRGTSPFFIATHFGVAHLISPLPVEEDLLSDYFKHDTLDLMKHKEITNVASAALQFKTGTIVLENPNSTSPENAFFTPPALPVVTRLMIAGATAGVEELKHRTDINKFQLDASAAWLKLSGAGNGLPRVRNGEANITDMTPALADDYLERMKQSFKVKETIKGKEVEQLLPPMWLFNTYTDEGTREYETLAHFVVVQPNVIVRSSITGRDELLSGSIAVRVESFSKSKQQIQYEVMQLLRSNHGFARLYIISPSPSIKESVSAAWTDLILTGRVHKDLGDWLQFGEHETLNSSKERLKRYSRPASFKAARSWIQG